MKRCAVKERDYEMEKRSRRVNKNAVKPSTIITQKKSDEEWPREIEKRKRNQLRKKPVKPSKSRYKPSKAQQNP